MNIDPIRPISLYTGGVGLSGSVSPVDRVKPVRYAKQPEIVEFHEKEPEDNNQAYKSSVLDKAMSFYDRQAGNYNPSGNMAMFDVAGAGFDAQA